MFKHLLSCVLLGSVVCVALLPLDGVYAADAQDCQSLKLDQIKSASPKIRGILFRRWIERNRAKLEQLDHPNEVIHAYYSSSVALLDKWGWRLIMGGGLLGAIVGITQVVNTSVDLPPSVYVVSGAIIGSAVTAGFAKFFTEYTSRLQRMSFKQYLGDLGLEHPLREEEYQKIANEIGRTFTSFQQWGRDLFVKALITTAPHWTRDIPLEYVIAKVLYTLNTNFPEIRIMPRRVYEEFIRLPLLPGAEEHLQALDKAKIIAALKDIDPHINVQEGLYTLIFNYFERTDNQ